MRLSGAARGAGVAGAVRLLVLLAVVGVGGGCSVTSSDLLSLADEPPVPYSVLVTGGAFVSVLPLEPGEGGDSLLTTYVDQGPDARRLPGSEAVPLEAFESALRTARVFVRVDRDTRTADARAALVASLEDGRVGASAASAFAAAAAAGHDYVLTIDKLADGRVQEYGINGRWPITAVAWLALGIGLVIPDHTFESRAALHIALRDAHTGRLVYERVHDGDPVDLALIDRTDFWGLVQSILIPPFWVGSDDEAVLSQVRRETTRRLLYLLAQDLKSASCRAELEAGTPASIRARRTREGLRLDVSSAEGVNFVSLRVLGVDESARAELEGVGDALLRTERLVEGRVVYGLEFALPRAVRDDGRFLQVLVQTVSGQVASITVDLQPRSARPN